MPLFATSPLPPLMKMPKFPPVTEPCPVFATRPPASKSTPAPPGAVEATLPSFVSVPWPWLTETAAMLPEMEPVAVFVTSPDDSRMPRWSALAMLPEFATVPDPPVMNTPAPPGPAPAMVPPASFATLPPANMPMPSSTVAWIRPEFATVPRAPMMRTPSSPPLSEPVFLTEPPPSSVTA